MFASISSRCSVPRVIFHHKSLVWYTCFSLRCGEYVEGEGLVTFTLVYATVSLWSSHTQISLEMKYNRCLEPTQQPPKIMIRFLKCCSIAKSKPLLGTITQIAAPCAAKLTDDVSKRLSASSPAYQTP